MLVNLFLEEPVPPSGTALWKDWQGRCRNLPASDATPAFIAALKQGSEVEQYAALLGLRLFGFYAYAEGYGAELIYRLRAPGASSDELIEPEHPPEDYQP